MVDSLPLLFLADPELLLRGLALGEGVSEMGVSSEPNASVVAIEVRLGWTDGLTAYPAFSPPDLGAPASPAAMARTVVEKGRAAAGALKAARAMEVRNMMGGVGRRFDKVVSFENYYEVVMMTRLGCCVVELSRLGRKLPCPPGAQLLPGQWRHRGGSSGITCVRLVTSGLHVVCLDMSVWRHGEKYELHMFKPLLLVVVTIQKQWMPVDHVPFWLLDDQCPRCAATEVLYEDFSGTGAFAPNWSRNWQ